MQESLQTDELFDVYYDVYETLFERIRELRDAQHDLATLKTMRDHVIRAVAAMENIEPDCIYQELEGVRHIEAGSETK